MKRASMFVAVALMFALTAFAQTTAGSDTGAGKKKKSSKGAASDTATAGSDMKSSKAGGNTVTGCLNSDSSGGYTITNGRYKNGMKVTGSDDLSKHVGHKVQLTGSKSGSGQCSMVATAHSRRRQDSRYRTVVNAG